MGTGILEWIFLHGADGGEVTAHPHRVIKTDLIFVVGE